LGRLTSCPVDKIVGRPFTDLVHAEDREAFRAFLASDMPAEPLSVRLVVSNGQPQPVRITMQAAYAGAAGGIDSIVVVVEAVGAPEPSATLLSANPSTSTQGRQVQPDSRQSEILYQHLLRAASDLVFTIPCRGGRSGPISHSPGCAVLFGGRLTSDSTTARSWYRLIAPEERRLVNAQLRLVVRKLQPTTFSHRLLMPDGSLHWVQTSLLPRTTEAGELLAIDGIVFETDGNTVAIQQLRQRETYYRAAIETSSDSFLILDKSGHILESNEGYIRYSGYTRTELLDKHILDCVAADSIGQLEAHICRACTN
jgi:PAS domain-containing protein